MRGEPGWRVATFVLGGTTLVLAALLATQPSPTMDAEPEPRPATTTDEAGGRNSTRTPRPRVHVDTEPSVLETPAADPPMAATETAAQAPDERLAFRARIAALPADEVCRLLAGPTTVFVDEVVARLATAPERERAAGLLEDWLRRRREITSGDLGLTIGAPVADVYAELRGPAAAPLLSELVFEQGENVVSALVRTGDPAALQRLDALQRDPTRSGFWSVVPIAQAGPSGLELLRGWALEDGVRRRLQDESRQWLWTYGTDEDRDRLLAATPTDVVLGRFNVTIPRSASAEQRLHEIAAQQLDSPDPWLRVLAARWVLMWRWRCPIELVAHAVERARVDCLLPCPGGRDAADWRSVGEGILRQIADMDERPLREHRIREVLGLPPPSETDGTHPR